MLRNILFKWKSLYEKTLERSKPTCCRKDTWWENMNLYLSPGYIDGQYVIHSRIRKNNLIEWNEIMGSFPLKKRRFPLYFRTYQLTNKTKITVALGKKIISIIHFQKSDTLKNKLLSKRKNRSFGIFFNISLMMAAR